MLQAVVNFCVRERLVVLALTAAVLAAGAYCAREVPVDAIPNVGENQVIVLTAWRGRSPKDVEDQITYPLSVRLLAVPHAQSVRGRSMFGFSFVQVTFSDDTDLYWARSRVVEQLATIAEALPPGVAPTLAPDATALGQIFYYVLEPPPGMNLAEVRSLQDFVLKYELRAVEGVSEVASIGGYVRQYQIEVDPDRLRFHDIPLDRLVQAVRDSSIDVGAKTVESNGMEYIIRGRGFIGADRDLERAVQDIEQTVVLSREGVPVRIRDLGQVQLGPELREGALDLDGNEVVGGVVVMRFGENPRRVIERVVHKLRTIEPSLNGVKVHAIYDRTTLIDETIATLTDALREEVVITVATITLFLLHVRASLVVAVTLPMAVLMSFIGMKVFGVDANIMSLAGIAIAIGEVADLGIIIAENIYQHLVEWEQRRAVSGSAGAPARQRQEVIVDATLEVAPAVLTGVSTTIVSFFPIFDLSGRDYKLFAPLAWTKTFAMAAAILVAVLLAPLLCRLLLRTSHWSRPTRWIATLAASLAGGLGVYLGWDQGLSQYLPLDRWGSSLAVAAAAGVLTGILSRERLRPIEENPTSRLILGLYTPVLRLLLAHKFAFLAAPLLIVALGLGASLGTCGRFLTPLFPGQGRGSGYDVRRSRPPALPGLTCTGATLDRGRSGASLRSLR